jgi:putative acetyltransferase
MIVTIRSRNTEDKPSILAVVREAFTSAERDGQEEVDIVVSTWALGATPDGLELVAVSGGEVIGHVLGATGSLDGHEIVAIAPLCVAPARQGQGIGSALMEELLRRTARQGWPLVAILGNPAYYQRFGFEPSGPLGIVYPPVGGDSPHFQVRRLPSFEPSLQGEFRYCWE